MGTRHGGKASEFRFFLSVVFLSFSFIMVLWDEYTVILFLLCLLRLVLVK